MMSLLRLVTKRAGVGVVGPVLGVVVMGVTVVADVVRLGLGGLGQGERREEQGEDTGKSDARFHGDPFWSAGKGSEEWTIRRGHGNFKEEGRKESVKRG